jgi:hypothetical protein
MAALFLVEHMHFQLLRHKPRCFRSGIRTMRASTRASLQSHNIADAAANHIFVVRLQVFYLSGGFLRGTPLSEDASVPQTCGP